MLFILMIGNTQVPQTAAVAQLTLPTILPSCAVFGKLYGTLIQITDFLSLFQSAFGICNILILRGYKPLLIG